MTYSKGFIIVGDKGQMMVYITTGELNNPYQ
jgi:WD40 repeat protein